MDKLILSDNTEIEILDGASIHCITVAVNDFTAYENLTKRLTRENLKNIKIKTDDLITSTYTNMALTEPNYKVTQMNGYLEICFGLEEVIDEFSMTEEMKLAATYLTDKQALTVKNLYTDWEDDAIGYSYSLDNPYDTRRKYNNRLWKLKMAHKKQIDWYPGAAPTLWTEIVEGHVWTKEDPIPVPNSVTTSGFEYEYGKYYLDNGKIYLAKREGKKDGEIETLYFPPSALIGQYFVVVE